MINEKKVRELYRIAQYDAVMEERNRKAGRYYRKDYIALEMIKSFFAGTFLYFLVLAMCGLNMANSLLDKLNAMDFVEIAIYLVVLYLAFLAIYLLATYLIYYIRYTRDTKILKRYMGHLRKLEKMYSREEKLKM